MLLLLGGTSEGLVSAQILWEEGWSLMVSTATENGARAYRERGIPVRWGRLDEQGWLEWLRAASFTAIVDAAHPFATELHRQVFQAAVRCGVAYYRLERSAADSLIDSPALHWVEGYEQAAEEAPRWGKRILLSTGSKSLPIFVRNWKERAEIAFFVRLLPTPENMLACRRLGIGQAAIAAMQGPFSADLNRALYRHWEVEVLVSKESGDGGNLRAKVTSAFDLGLHVVLIRRPQLLLPGAVIVESVDQLLGELENRFGRPQQ